MCYENIHCASSCCAKSADEDTKVIYEEDLAEIETKKSEILGNSTEAEEDE